MSWWVSHISPKQRKKKLRNVLQNSLWASVNCLSHTATAFPAQRPNCIKAMLKITFLSHTYSSLWCMFVFYLLALMSYWSICRILSYPALPFELKCSKNIANIISPNLTSSCVFLVAGGGGTLMSTRAECVMWCYPSCPETTTQDNDVCQ